MLSLSLMLFRILPNRITTIILLDALPLGLSSIYHGFDTQIRVSLG